MKKLFLGLAILTCASSVRAQTTTLNQTSLTCQPLGCANATLSDGELFSYNGPGSRGAALSFRGIQYFADSATCPSPNHPYPACGTSQIITANKGQFVANETFKQVFCYRCIKWQNLSGSLTIPNEYAGIQIPPAPAYGLGGVTPFGAPNPTSTSAQVGLAVASSTDTIVTLTTTATSNDPNVQPDPNPLVVPSTVTIPAGSLYANFTVSVGTATVINEVSITATFPDGQTSTTEQVTVYPPAPTDDSFLHKGGEGNFRGTGTDGTFSVTLISNSTHSRKA